MIKNFSKVKEQLIELSEVINSFKSENVQVRLIELLFEPQESKSEVEAVMEKPIVKRTRKPKEQVQEEQPVTKRKKIRKTRSKDRPGPSVILKKLVDEEYFTERRGIGDIVNYCLSKYNYKYKSTDLSGTLARLVKEEILKREKNATTNQFEYYQ